MRNTILSRLSVARSGMRFGLLGVASSITTLGITALCHEVFSIPEELAYLLALATAILQNFFGMRYYVYPETTQPILKQFLYFLTSSLSFRTIEYVAFLFLHTWAGVHYLIATVFIMLLSFISKFFFYRHKVFR